MLVTCSIGRTSHQSLILYTVARLDTRWRDIEDGNGLPVTDTLNTACKALFPPCTPQHATNAITHCHPCQMTSRTTGWLQVPHLGYNTVIHLLTSDWSTGIGPHRLQDGDLGTVSRFMSNAFETHSFRKLRAVGRGNIC